jgi:hypothetical protein
VLTYRWRPRWARLSWAITWLAGLGVAAGVWQTFTDYGHLCALAIGLVLYPTARGCARVERRLRTRLRRRRDEHEDAVAPV